MANIDKYLNFPRPRTAMWTDDLKRLKRPDGEEVTFITDSDSRVVSSANSAGPHPAILRSHGDSIALPTDVAVNQMVLLHGRSNAIGNYGWPIPPLSQVSSAVLMMGDSVRSYDADEAYFSAPGTYPWVQQGAGQFKPLALTVEVGGNQRSPAASEVLAILDVNNGAQGENALYAGVTGFALDWSARGGTGRHYTCAVTGVGGKTIDELVPGASPNRWQRVTDCLALHSSLAASGSGLSGSETCAMLAAVYVSGENDTHTHSQYTGYLQALHQGIITEASSRYGSKQIKQPALFLELAAGPWIPPDTAHMGAMNATVDYALTTPGVYLIGSFNGATDRSTSATDKGHLDTNGHRRDGEKLAQVMSHVLLDGRKWMPCLPQLIAKTEPNQVDVHVFAPFGPLRAQSVFCGYNEMVWADLGFTVIDASGTVPITSVTIQPGSIVRIALGRYLAGEDGQITVRYADEAHLGTGNICDSDPTVARNAYQWIEGMPAQAKLTAYIGKPLPMANWLIPFERTVGYDIRATINPPSAETEQPGELVLSGFNDPLLSPYLLHLFDADDSASMSLSGSTINSITSGPITLTGAGATKPTLNATGGPTGGACIETAGVGYFEAAAVGSLPTGTAGCEIAAICRQDAPLGDTTIRYVIAYGGAGAAGARAIRRSVASGTEQRLGIMGGTSSLTDHATVQFSGWHAVLARMNDGYISGMIDQVEVTGGSIQAAITTASDRTRIFAAATVSATGVWNGSFAKIAVLKPMPPSIRRALMAHMQTAIGA